MMIHLLHQRLTVATFRESRELSFKQPDASGEQFVDANNSENAEGAPLDAEITPERPEDIAREKLKEAERITKEQVTKHRAALEAEGKMKKEGNAPLSRVEKADVSGGAFGVHLLPFSTKTDNEYAVLRSRPSERQKAFLLKIANAEKAEIEKYISANREDWDADVDGSKGAMSIPKRTIMNRLALIEEIGRYNPDRRKKAMEWKEKQRVASEESEQEYQDMLECLWSEKEGERYPLSDGLKTFIVDFAVPLFQKTQDARRTLAKTSMNSPLYEDHRDLYQSAKELERGRIDMNYANWRDTPFEDVFRNRFAQLLDDDSEYKRDLARISEPLSEEDKIAEYLESKGKGNAEKFKQRHGKILYSNLSDFDREQFRRYKGSSQSKTITQWEFDKKHFRFADLVSSENKLPGLDSELKTKLDTAIDSIAADLQEQPPLSDTVEAFDLSVTAKHIDASLRELVTGNDKKDGKKITQVFLNEMKKIGPQRIKAVAGLSFNIKDDDGQFRWYEFRENEDGTYGLENVNPVIRYADVSDEQKKLDVSDHVIYRHPDEESADIAWQMYAEEGVKPLPESIPDDPEASTTRRSINAQKSVREMQEAVVNREAATLTKAVGYFNEFNDFKNGHDGKVPTRFNLQMERMMRDLNRKFVGTDNAKVNRLVGADVEKVVQGMQDALKKNDRSMRSAPYAPDILPFSATQRKLSPEDEQSKLQSIKNREWIDARYVSNGDRGWEYKRGSDGGYYARYGNDIQQYSDTTGEWVDMKAISGITDKDTLRLYMEVFNKGGDLEWLTDADRRDVSYHIDLKENFFEKKEGDTTFFYDVKNNIWIEEK